MAQAGSYCCSGQPIPSAGIVSDYIAPIWMDWVGAVSTETLGSAGSRQFVLNWTGYEFGSGSLGNFQTILREGSNDIEFQYADTVDNSHVATIGISNPTGTDGLQYINGHPTGLSNTGLLISAHSVPEPAPLALLGIGLAGLCFSRRRKS